MNWTEFIEFIASVLYLYIAWLSGVLLGYLIGRRDGEVNEKNQHLSSIIHNRNHRLPLQR